MPLGLLSGTVRVVPHDPGWAAEFAAERARLGESLGDVPAIIEHVGSTSVPGLPAKPILDVIVGRPPESALSDYVGAFERIGYIYRGELGLPGREYFVRGMEPVPRTHHLHLVLIGSDHWLRTLAFRDHLRRHPEAAQAYAALKGELAKRYPTDRGAYTAAKDAFIQEAIART